MASPRRLSSSASEISWSSATSRSSTDSKIKVASWTTPRNSELPAAPKLLTKKYLDSVASGRTERRGYPLPPRMDNEFLRDLSRPAHDAFTNYLKKSRAYAYPLATKVENEIDFVFKEDKYKKELFVAGEIWADVVYNYPQEQIERALSILSGTIIPWLQKNRVKSSPEVINYFLKELKNLSSTKELVEEKIRSAQSKVDTSEYGKFPEKKLVADEILRRIPELPLNRQLEELEHFSKGFLVELIKNPLKSPFKTVDDYFSNSPSAPPWSGPTDEMGVFDKPNDKDEKFLAYSPEQRKNIVSSIFQKFTEKNAEDPGLLLLASKKLKEIQFLESPELQLQQIKKFLNRYNSMPSSSSAGTRQPMNFSNSPKVNSLGQPDSLGQPTRRIDKGFHLASNAEFSPEIPSSAASNKKSAAVPSLQSKPNPDGVGTKAFLQPKELHFLNYPPTTRKDFIYENLGKKIYEKLSAHPALMQEKWEQIKDVVAQESPEKQLSAMKEFSRILESDARFLQKDADSRLEYLETKLRAEVQKNFADTPHLNRAAWKSIDSIKNRPSAELQLAGLRNFSRTLDFIKQQARESSSAAPGF